ncbi:Protein of uncharacterised function (DUF2637) [Mycobacteroides abscessus]|uniref:DUF2637 domain-containing protein n=1 Tax=Mycobacteroides abscessus TaxID=36809 RepID=UPI0005E9F78E|nr:DUF2637 domain-containing protein [Mycobacteroides abscessus]CPS11017.1 Protein of uncharacterised function (DUF2637) [Mycobacteroides abscessus]CPS50666.1 Protein of uncharacterised function (DUF2637) [Mycobacteroides abscessus]CPS93509.1 Protein of uncharacterised function (DUF2637) [Mycobacteroides abscessus]CPS94445.1 Protein of uncharacterised function (DUF2637) [Mycobacteroides abscessus]CPT61533.1 Protein of uncharacterised function (DUF2637) [Mycobacteroides abscessus]
MHPHETARREVRRIIWALLCFGAVMSLAGNVVHSYTLHGWSWRLIGPVVAAVIAPVALLGLMHLMGAWTRWPESDGASYWVFLVGVVVLGGAAFRLSFAALRDLAVSYGYGRIDAALFPLILDGLMALMTWGLVAATRPKVAHQSAAADVPGPVATAVAEPVQVTMESAVAEPVYAPEPPHPAEQPQMVQPVESAPRQAVQADAPAVTSDDEVVHQPAPLVHQSEETETVQAPERPRLVAVQADTAAVQAAQSSETPVVHESVDTTPVHVRREAKPAAVHQPAADAVQAPEVLPVHLEQAEAVVQRGGTELQVERIAEVYARKDAGESQNSIAKTVPVNKRTVAKVLTARAELDADPDSNQTA